MAVTWKQFTELRPDIAAAGGAMIKPGDVGLGFLATVRPDGGPRVNPICPVLTDHGLYGFLVVGPKLHDLRRDPRYALHSETVPPPHYDDAFSLKGTIVELPEAEALRAELTEQFLAERSLDAPWDGFEDQALVEFEIERCLLTLTEPRPDLPKGHSVWLAPSA
jgi:hypothetical protein